MAQIKFEDELADGVVWDAIKQSPNIKDYEDYLRLFQDAEQDKRACASMDKLMHLSKPADEDLSCFSKAFEGLFQLAQSGDTSSRFYLAKCFSLGLGVASNWKEAVKYYQLAGLDGDPRAYHNIARAYYDGENEEQNYLKSAEYFEKAYELGRDSQTVWMLSRMHIHGYGYEQDVAKGIGLILQEAEAGDAYARAVWGAMLRNGDGIPKDDEEGWKHILQSASEGSAYGQYVAGYSYEFGYTVEKDFSTAAKWYLLAAEKGWNSAQENLGILYMLGQGVRKDGAEGIKWLKYAAFHGNASASRKLGITYHDGIDAIPNSKEASVWFQYAVDKGDESSLWRLADLYDAGEGVEQDREKANELYLKSAKIGYLPSQFSIGLSY